MKAFRLNRTDVWAAESMEQAIAMAVVRTGQPRDIICDHRYAGEVPAEDLECPVVTGDKMRLMGTVASALANLEEPCLLFATSQ